VSAKYKEYKGPLKRCDYCGKFGHLMTQCYKRLGYPQKRISPKKEIQTQRVKYKEVWKPKSTNKNLMAHTPLRLSSYEDWYFDSGCSKHMTGKEKDLKELKTHPGGNVIFGDGDKGRIKGIGKLSNPNPLCLDNVLLVEGLTANLISISQLCEQGSNVHFNNSECTILNGQ
jgi:hypothetical protein